MKKILIGILFMLSAGIMAHAQDNKEYEAAMTKMMEVSKSMEMMNQMSSQIISMLKQQATSTVPDEFYKSLEAEMVKMYAQIVKELIPIYQKYLTLQDLKGIIKFYETPVGKKLADSNTKMSVEIMPIAQKVGMETVQRLIAEMKEKGYIKQ